MNFQISTLNRRDFLHLSALGLIGAALPSHEFTAFDPIKWKPAKLSVQLYTVRDQIKSDIPGTLKTSQGDWF